MFNIILLTTYIQLSVLLITASSLDFWAKLGEALTGIAAVVAVVAFIYQIWRDRTISAVDQVTFFREKIIPTYEDFLKELRESLGDKGYRLPRIKVEAFNIATIKATAPELARAQVEAITKGFNSLDVKNSLVLFINLMEDFSLRVIYMKSANHEALSAVKDAFVAIIEDTITGILTVRLNAGSKTFSGMEKLYLMWRDSVDRRSIEERIKAVAGELETKG